MAPTTSSTREKPLPLFDLPLEIRQQIYSYALIMDSHDFQHSFVPNARIYREVAVCLGDRRMVSAAQFEFLSQAVAEFSMINSKVFVRSEDILYVNRWTNVPGIVGLMRSLGLTSVVLDLREWGLDYSGVERFLTDFLKGAQVEKKLEVENLVLFLWYSRDLDPLRRRCLRMEQESLVRKVGGAGKVKRIIAHSDCFGIASLRRGEVHRLRVLV